MKTIIRWMTRGRFGFVGLVAPFAWRHRDEIKDASLKAVKWVQGHFKSEKPSASAEKTTRARAA